MLSESEECCDLWEEVPLVPILHSRLCDLEPVGMGSPMVESLTSYITRLADAHSVSPITLVINEILPRVNPPHVQQEGRSVSAQVSSVFRESALLNGVAGGTQSWVVTLEQLTGRRDLRFLTLLTFSNVLPPRKLLRRKRAWCPLCYQKWRDAHLVVYEPLLWNVECVTACLHHDLPLCQCCPYPDCGTVLLPLEPKLFPGYCPKCHRWMGSCEQMALPISAEADEQWQWQCWIKQMVGELLATQPMLSVSPCRERIAATLTTYLDTFMNGNQTELARRLNRHVSSIRDWQRGKQLPHLGNLLRICFLFEMTLVSLLTEHVPQRTLPSPTVLQKSVPGGRTRRHMRRFDANEIEQALEEALQEDPPPSMRQVAKRLGYDPSHVYKRFPQLCQAISQRRQVDQTKNKNIRLQRDQDELREAMYKLHEQGLYPGQTQLQKVLSKPGVLRDTQMRATWSEVLQELGWKP
jgi:transcriptional regulator with XRE-family HTH domain